MPGCPPAAERGQAFSLWLQAGDFQPHLQTACRLIEQLLAENPHTTLQVILEPTGDPRSLTAELFETLHRACFRQPTYLDRFYAILPGSLKGAKRLVVTLPIAQREILGWPWIDLVGQYATLAWQGAASAEAELDPHEYVFAATDATHPHPICNQTVS